MERHVTNLMSVVLVVATLVASGCGGGSSASNTAASLAQPVSVAGTVALPSGSTAKASDLVVQTNTNSSTISASGSFSTQGVSADSAGSTLAIVTTKSGNPVFLKQAMADGSNSSSPIDAKSTAAAIVLYDPVFLRRSATDQLTARNNLLLHARFTELVTLIENAVMTDSVAPLDATTHQDIYNLAAIITKDLLANLPMAKLATLAKATDKTARKMDPNNYIGIEDDPDQNTSSVFLVNNTYAYYDVTIKKAGTTTTNVNPPTSGSASGSIPWRVSRKSLVGLALAWPPVSINEAVKEEASLGDGDFSFDFTKKSGLSVFDGVMSLASTIIGVKSDSIDTLDIGYQLLIKTGDSINTVINSLVLQKPNTWDEANAMCYDVIVNKGGLSIILDYAKTYFAAKIKATFNDSWFLPLTKIIASKMVVLGTGAYGTAEVAAIVISVAQAPDTYSESGTQTKGKYPATTITSLNPAQIVIGSTVTITGTGFGTTSGIVRFNGTLAQITSWSDKQIVVTIASGTTAGSAVVYAGGVASNNMPFTISGLNTTFSIQSLKAGQTVTASLDEAPVVTVSGQGISYSNPITLAHGSTHTLRLDGTISVGNLYYVWAINGGDTSQVKITPSPSNYGYETGPATYSITIN